MTCKMCCAFPHLAVKTQFFAGCHTFKKESLQKHSFGGSHLHAHDPLLAKQKPVQNLPNVKGLQQEGKAAEENTRKELEAKFNPAYLIAKEELLFTKYQAFPNGFISMMIDSAADRGGKENKIVQCLRSSPTKVARVQILDPVS